MSGRALLINCRERCACHAPCKTLTRELRAVEVPQRDIVMPPSAVLSMIDGRSNNFAQPTAERQAIVAEVYEALPERRRRCLELYFKERLSPTAVARQLGISRSAVRVHLRRALAAVFEQLDDVSLDDCPRDIRPERRAARVRYLVGGNKSKYEGSQDLRNRANEQKHQRFMEVCDDDGNQRQAG